MPLQSLCECPHALFVAMSSRARMEGNVRQYCEGQVVSDMQSKKRGLEASRQPSRNAVTCETARGKVYWRAKS